ncbi:hypothetical protein [Herbiconiux sp. A18JL235]|uniref:Uncharacterized protein n=1 Tax=Herbiconiux sp. A18JL235 TaxID=3152363 RepID=A0AB39BI10_9MICO
MTDVITTVRAHLPLFGMGSSKAVDIATTDGHAPTRVVERFTIDSVRHSRTWALVHDAGDVAFYHFEADTSYSFPRRSFPTTPSAIDPTTT